MALRNKSGVEQKFSRRRAAAGSQGLAGAVGGRGNKRFRQAFAKRLAFAQQTGALPAASFDPIQGRRVYQGGLVNMIQTQPVGTFQVLARRKR